MKKPIFIYNILKATFILMLLMFVFTKNEQLYLRMIIISFILLTICYLTENLFYLFNKPKEAKMFHKLFITIFLLFGAGFLVGWSYAWIKEAVYFPLIFTIPFWVCEVYIFRKSILEIKSDKKKALQKNKLDFKLVVSGFLVICVLISGLVCLVIGIKDTYQTKKKTQNYLTTTGYFKDYEIYSSSNKDKPTYRLIYIYEIDGQEYSLKTDYGSGSIPSENSEREIKYNPNNPSEAVFTGTNRNSGLIYFGVFFILGSMVFVLIFLSTFDVFANIKFNVIGLYVGFVLLIVGIGIIAFQMGEVSTLIEVIKRMKFWILIPLMFIIVGIFQIIKCLFFERMDIKKSNKLMKKSKL